jgi:uncharacterized protein (TIGR02569 family)
MEEFTIRKFTESRHIEKLSGGQNTSVRVGDLVLKPIDGDMERYVWLATTLEHLRPSGVVLSRPVRSLRGQWIEDSIVASEYHQGSFYPGRMPEKISASVQFHAAVKHISKPQAFSRWESPWISASQVAWGERNLPSVTDAEIVKYIRILQGQYRALHLSSQFVHSDLAGNILFHGSTPLLIDISPDFRPVEYTITMLVTDSIAWHEEPLESIQLLDFADSMKAQLILRAVVFRVCVPIFFQPQNVEWFLSEFRNFEGILRNVELWE